MATVAAGELSPNIDDETAFERAPVPESKTKGLGSFLGLFASEHVAATELLIGPLFVAAGVSAFDLLGGLLLGNILAVATWTLLTSPIAVKKRLTLYYQLEQIGGPSIIKVYTALTGLLWCGLGGAFIYVSATALFVPFGIEQPKLHEWAPTSFGMAALVIATGLVIVVVAARGYDAMARFANVASPWLAAMFLLFGVTALVELGANSVSDLWPIANRVWDGTAAPGHTQFTFWHVVCFAWFGNMAWHFGMADLTILRFAKKASYGLTSAAGMMLGHYLAWIAAGLLYAVQLQHNPLDTGVAPGPMAYRVAGPAGILLALVAGWATATPIIYRAGMAFQALLPGWSRLQLTVAAGGLACLVATFPGVCNSFLSVAMLYGLILMPMGAVIFADFYFMERLGLEPAFAHRHSLAHHWPPLAAWAASVAFCALLWVAFGVQEFFLCLPGWLLATAVYLACSAIAQKKRRAGQ